MKQIKVLLVIFTFFSIMNGQLFAAPGGGKGGNGGGGAGGNGGAPSPKKPDEPSGITSNKAGENHTSSSPSASESSKPNAPEAFPDSAPIPEPAPMPPAKPAPAKLEDNVIYYRGARTVLSDDAFEVSEVKTARVNDSTVTVEITFNQSINPKSVSYASILVDNATIPEKTKFSFNKKGDTIRITVPSTKNSFMVHIQGVASYDGTVLQPVDLLATIGA